MIGKGYKWLDVIVSSDPVYDGKWESCKWEEFSPSKEDWLLNQTWAQSYLYQLGLHLNVTKKIPYIVSYTYDE